MTATMAKTTSQVSGMCSFLFAAAWAVGSLIMKDLLEKIFTGRAAAVPRGYADSAPLASRACCRSAIRSAGSSSPTLKRKKPSR